MMESTRTNLAEVELNNLIFPTCICFRTLTGRLVHVFGYEYINRISSDNIGVKVAMLHLVTYLSVKRSRVTRRVKKSLTFVFVQLLVPYDLSFKQ